MSRQRSKPIVLGVIHGQFHVPKSERQMIAREKERVLQVLERLPPGTRVGIEAPRKGLDRLGAYSNSRDVLTFAARTARRLDHEIVALDLDSALRRHDQITLQIHHFEDQLRCLEPLGLPTGTLNHHIDRLFIKQYALAIIRSVLIGKRINKEKPQVAVIGDTHARDLKNVLQSTHQVMLSPAGSDMPIDFVSNPLIAPLKAKLDAHLLKRLKPSK